MSNSFLRLALSVLVISMLNGCASTSTVEDPAESFFIRFYGGDGDQTGVDFVTLPDNSMILFGTTKASTPGSKMHWYVVKVDSKGMVLAGSKSVFGDPNADQEARDIELVGTNQIVLLGNIYKSTTDRDIKIMTMSTDLVPVDSAVVPTYDRFTGLATTGDEDATSVTPISDGFMIAGSSTYLFTKTVIAGYSDIRDGLNIRLTTSLQPYDINWIRATTNGNYSDDVTQKVIQVSDGFYVFGYSDASVTGQTVKNYNFWYYKLGLTGISANNAYIGVQTDDEKMTSFDQVPVATGDGFILCGSSTNTSSGASDITVAKLRKTLVFDPTDYQFQKSLGIKIGSSPNSSTSVLATQLGGYYVLANENGFNGNQNWVLTRLNTDASPAWNQPIVFGGEGIDRCGSVKDLPDGRIALIGSMTTGKSDVGETKMTLIKVNGEGQLK